MGAGFVRRFTDNPGIDALQQIEGVAIIDIAPPGTLSAVGVGTVGLIGEFADMKYATQVASTGEVTTKIKPVEVYGSQDAVNKFGGFDWTIGDTGKSFGSGFLTIRNKKFSRLVLGAVNLCSNYAVRLWRSLPTNKSATNPTSCVPLVGATVSAGREFKSSGNRIHVGTKVVFTQSGEVASGVDGSVTSAGSATSQTFSAASGTFLSLRVKAGDLLVLGVIGAVGAQGANAGTYRVVSDAVGETSLTVEKQDGSSFDWTSGTSLAWRLHPWSDGESGIGNAATASAYTIPARPIDSTITAATICAPSTVPSVATGTSWDPLSDLTMRTHVTQPLTYTAAIQAENAVASSSLDTLYTTAFDAFLGEDLPQRDVSIIIPCRTSAVIRAYQLSHVLTASAQGVGRVTIVTPELDQADLATVVGDASPGVGANRNDRLNYTFPGAQTFVSEAVGYALKLSDGTDTTDGLLDTPSNGWLASVLSVLAPERNPGEVSDTTKSVLGSVLALSKIHQGTLTMDNYKTFKARGICALRIDKDDGALFQSGITTSLTAGLKNQNRRRMADYIQDNSAQILSKFCKQPLTTSLKDSALGELDVFLSNLLTNQRIDGYLLDDKEGNTSDTEAAGIFVINEKIKTVSSADVIVINSQIGEAVSVTAQ